jgi:hypothetical protein
MKQIRARECRMGITRNLLPCLLLALASCGGTDEEMKPLAPPWARSYIPSAQDPKVLKMSLNSSMKARREFGWKVAEQAFLPATLSASPPHSDVVAKFPNFLAWYDVRDFIQIYDLIRLLKQERDQQIQEKSSRPTTYLSDDQLVDIAFRMHDDKSRKQANAKLDKLRSKLANLESRLQDELKVATVHDRGFILYSPSLLKHVLKNEERVRNCRNEDFPPYASPLDLPDAIRPSDPNNNFAMCLNSEFPRDAVMVKTSWQRLDVPLKVRQSDAAGIADLFTRKDDGYFNVEEKVTLSGNEAFVLKDAAGLRWALRGVHFSTKEIAEWVWVSLWYHPKAEGDFGADRPKSFERVAPYLKNFKMCVTTGTEEGDTKPESHYRSDARLASLGEAIAESRKRVSTKQWCANPYLEPSFAKSNCVTCHLAAGLNGRGSFVLGFGEPRTLGLTDFVSGFNTFRYILGGDINLPAGIRNGGTGN